MIVVVCPSGNAGRDVSFIPTNRTQSRQRNRLLIVFKWLLRVREVEPLVLHCELMSMSLCFFLIMYMLDVSQRYQTEEDQLPR
jgi:hypothetical protein